MTRGGFAPRSALSDRSGVWRLRHTFALAAFRGQRAVGTLGPGDTPWGADGCGCCRIGRRATAEMLSAEFLGFCSVPVTACGSSRNGLSCGWPGSSCFLEPPMAPAVSPCCLQLLPRSPAAARSCPLLSPLPPLSFVGPAQPSTVFRSAPLGFWACLPRRNLSVRPGESLEYMAWSRGRIGTGRSRP